MVLHPKIKALKLRSAPITYGTMQVREDGTLVDNKAVIADRTIKGYLIVWGVRDSYGTIFLKGCCAKSIQERGPGSNSKYKIVMLWQHHMDDPIGQFTVLQEDDYGLYFEAVVDDPETVTNAKRALHQIKSGTINQFSAGFDYVWDKMEYEDKTDSILLKEIDLFEGSPVTLGANMETFAYRAAATLETAKEFLHDETEAFIRTMPRNRQLELRQLFARHISLARIEPDEPRHRTLENCEPIAEAIDFNYLRKNFTL